MKPARLALLLGILIVLGAGCFYLFKSRFESKIAFARPYFVPLPFKGISSSNIPYWTVLVEGQAVDTQIDLGYNGSLSLPASVLQEVHEKMPLEARKNAGLVGKIYNINSYKIEKVKINEVSFVPDEIEELVLEQELETIIKDDGTGMDQPGRLGWHIFEGYNLLVDCKNEQFVLCDSLDTLKSHGYPVESFTTVPLLLDRGFLEFQATTDMGLKRCMLDTGTTWNMYNLGVVPGKKLPLFDDDDHFDSEQFQVGNKNYGLMTFHRIHSPFPLEAILGMEFIEDNAIFIDFENHKLHFYEYPKGEPSP